MKKQPIQLLSYLMILFSLLTTSVYAAVDNVNSISGSATITHGEEVTLYVDYVASQERDVVAYLKRTIGEKKNYYYKRVRVQAGDKIKQFTFTVPANAPTDANYKYGTYIAPVGKYFKDNLGKAYQQDVQVESDGGAEDDVNSISGPATIKHGESVTLNVDYLASQKRDLVVYLKSTTDTKRKSEVYIRREVDAGSETEQFTFTVPDDVPTDETYKYGVYIAPVGRYWKDNLGSAYQQDVHVESGDSEDNPPLTREELIELIESWVKDPSQNNADAISNANVSQISDMSHLFDGDRILGPVYNDFTDEEFDRLENFNLDISRWDVSNVTNMSSMFSSSTFNKPIGNWDVSSVTDMSSMFYHYGGRGTHTSGGNFNQDISNWDVSSVTNMKAMFEWSQFNQPIGNWDVSNVTNMSSMFMTTHFNQPIGEWDVSNVTNMSYMFAHALFNHDIGNWDVSSVTDMKSMFGDNPLMTDLGASFNKDISNWDVSSVLDSTDFVVKRDGVRHGSLLEDRYNPFMNDTITGQELIQGGGNDNGTLSKSAWSHFGNTYGSLERTYNGNTFIYASPRDVGSGMYQSVPTEVGKEYEVKAILIGSDANRKLPFNGESYLTIGDAVPTQTKANVFAESEHISGGTETEVSFRFTAQSTSTYLALRSDAQWHYASARALSMKEVGEGTTTPPVENPALTREQLQALVAEWKANPTQENADKISNANVSEITDMSRLFYSAKNFNLPIGDWDVSNVTNMSHMFAGAAAFNQPIREWDVSSVTDMGNMFVYARKFNQPIGEWDVSSVTDMGSMFNEAIRFNQPIGDWNVSNVTNMSSMFTISFNQPIGEWDVSSVTDMRGMFSYAREFNQPIGEWDVSSVTDMGSMFGNLFFGAREFNQPIGEWDVSSVTNMHSMFNKATSFNQPIGEWDVSSVTNMTAMFERADIFNQPIGDWDVSNVTKMSSMFWAATNFNQNIGNWDVTLVKALDNYRGFATNSALIDSYNPFLTGENEPTPNTWHNISIPTQNTAAVATFAAIPTANNLDTVIGFSNTEANAYSDLGIIVRFASNGKIDVKNGGRYAADTSIAYQANTEYTFRVDIDFSQHIYSVYVTAANSEEVLLANDYHFRTEQSTMSEINYMAHYSIDSATVVGDVSFSH